jgi:hypothetical protein
LLLNPENIRHERLQALERWVRANLAGGEIQTQEVKAKVMIRAIQTFGVSKHTALDYAEAVILRLKGETERGEDS